MNDQVARWMKCVKLQSSWGLLIASVILLGSCAWSWGKLLKLPMQHEKIDAQLMRVQSLAAQAQALQVQSISQAAPDLAKLNTQIIAMFGTDSQLRISGDTATLQLKGVSANVLARGLQQLQQQWHVSFASVQLQQVNGAVTGTLQLNFVSGS